MVGAVHHRRPLSKHPPEKPRIVTQDHVFLLCKDSRLLGLYNLQLHLPLLLSKPAFLYLGSSCKTYKRPIKLRKNEEQNAIYYIGGFRVNNEETLNFKIRVKTPDGASETIQLSQQFFTD